MNISKCLALALLFFGVLGATTCFAGKDKVTDLSVTYAGAGFDLTDPNGDGYPINVFITEGKGTFGKSSLMVLSEFAEDTDSSVTCPEGFDQAFDLVRCVTTMTTPQVDQLWGWFTGGYLCMTSDNMAWVGEASGIYIGGTGRFQRATGEWTTEYSGANFDADSGYRTISGTIEGTVNTP